MNRNAVSPHADFATSQAGRRRRFVDAHRPVIFVVAAGFLLRLAWLLFAQPDPVSDFHHYRQVAALLLDEGQFGYPGAATFYPPVHTIVLAGLMLVSRAELWLGFGMVLVSTASCLLVYLVGRRLFEQRSTALVAASIFAFMPTFVFYSPVLASEHVFIALMLLAMLAVLHPGEVSSRRAVAVGAVLALASLTRGEATFYVLGFLVFLWLAVGPGRATRARQGLLVAVGFVAVLTPWYVRNAVAGEAGLSSGSGINFYYAHNDTGIYGWRSEYPFPGMTAEEASREGWRLGLQYLRENPLRVFHGVRFTPRLFAVPEYALDYSTAEASFPGDPDFSEKDLPLLGVFRQGLRVTAMLHLSAAALALLLVRRWSRPLASLIVPLVALSWVWRTMIFWAAPRYSYFILVMAVFASALTIDTLARVGRIRPTSPTA